MPDFEESVVTPADFPAASVVPECEDPKGIPYVPVDVTKDPSITPSPYKIPVCGYVTFPVSKPNVMPFPLTCIEGTS